MKLVWDKIGDRYYETGVEQGALYPRHTDGTYPSGVVWNGLVSISESPSGAEPSPVYADNIKYLNLLSVEEFGGTIEAYTYPDEFAACDGTATLVPGVVIGQQSRQTFGLAYKTKLGNDTDLNDYGYKLHLIYGGLAAPSEKAYTTINDSPEAITFSWEITTTPVDVTGHKPTASITINSTKVDNAKLAILEGILYGTEYNQARLPLPDEIASIFGSATPAALAIDTIVPADEATAVALTSTIVITFNNKIQTEYITITSELGAIIAGAKTWNSAKKVLTFVPAADLDSNTTYFVAFIGVSDVYNQTLAPVTKSFTTV